MRSLRNLINAGGSNDQGDSAQIKAALEDDSIMPPNDEKSQQKSYRRPNMIYAKGEQSGTTSLNHPSQGSKQVSGKQAQILLQTSKFR